MKIMRIAQTDKGGPYVYIGDGNSMINIDLTERKRPKLILKQEAFPPEAEELTAPDVTNLMSELTRTSLAWVSEVDGLKSGVSGKDSTGNDSKEGNDKSSDSNEADSLPNNDDLAPIPVSVPER
jgi:hypothetical protein